ncbi:MAG: hypothetical protein QM488_04500 [Rhizobiaceae bacterium]
MMFLNGLTSTFFAIVIVSFTLLLDTTTTSKAGQIDYSGEKRCVKQCLKKGNFDRATSRVWCEKSPGGNYMWYWNRYKQVKSEYEKSISLCVNYGTHNGDNSGGGNYDDSKCEPWRNLAPKYQLAVNDFNACKKSLRVFNKCSNYCIKFRRTRLPVRPVTPVRPAPVPVPANSGFELFWNGKKVSGPDARNFTRSQANSACQQNQRSGVRVECRFNGVSFQSVGDGPIPVPAARGFELFWNGKKVNGPDAQNFTRSQANSACQQNQRSGVRVECRFNGVSF